MSYVSEDRLMTLFDVPVTLPQSTIYAGVVLAIGTVQLPANSKLDLRWLQLFVIEADSNSASDPCGATSQFIINANYPAGGIATILLVQNWTPAADPWTQIVIAAATVTLTTTAAPSPISLPQIAALNPAAPVDISTAGNYTFIVINNTTNKTLDISVTGAATLDIDPVATS